jgi:hypothetical protein
VLANSSSDEEEGDGEENTSDRWEPAPPSPRAEGAAVELTLEAGTELPIVGSSVEVPAGTVEALVGIVEVHPNPQGRGSGASPA